MAFNLDYSDGKKDSKLRRYKSLVLISVFLVSSVGSAILVEDYGVLSEDVSVEQAIVVDGQKGAASLNPDLPSGNLVGNGNTSKNWSMKVNVNGTVTTTVSLSGSSSSSLSTHFTDNISENNGMALTLDKKILEGSSDKTLDLSSESATVNLEGSTNSIEDAVRFETRFPINYDMNSRDPLEDSNLEIRIDASGASVS